MHLHGKTWDIVDAGFQLGAIQAGTQDGLRSPYTILLQHIPLHALPSTPKGKSGTPAYWHWNDADETTIVLLDSKYFPMQRFKITEQFRDQINGRYRRTTAQAHRHPPQASRAGNPGAVTGRTFYSIPVTFGPWADPIPESRPIDNAGIRTGEIVAHRAWLYMGRGHLRSMYKTGAVWLPGETMTGDPEDMRFYFRNVGHSMSGVHAFKEREYLMYYVMLYMQQWKHQRAIWYYERGDGGEEDQPHIILGTVELWGTVIEHEFGYRASHAAIASFSPQTKFDVLPLCEKYGVRCE